jgi:hypothetical protein
VPSSATILSFSSRLQRRRRTRLHTAGHNDGGSNSTQIR